MQNTLDYEHVEAFERASQVEQTMGTAKGMAIPQSHRLQQVCELAHVAHLTRVAGEGWAF